jgi:hypothetical protein
MKKTFIIAIVTCLAIRSFGQDVITVRIEQIAKLEVYLSYLKKGYDIANKGLTLIGDIKHGDFSMHQDYFNSLDVVNPQVKSDAKIAAMIAMQAQMLSAYKGYTKQFQGSGLFTTQEITYLARVFSAVLSDVAENITELTQVITDQQFQMKDGERIARIDRLYTTMTDNYNFLYSFCDQVQVQAAQRSHALQELQTIQKLY